MGLVSFEKEFEIGCVFLHSFPDYVPMLRPLCRVESQVLISWQNIKNPCPKEGIFLEVISFDVKMWLQVKGQLSPANGLREILLFRICQKRSVGDSKYHLGKLLLQC